jgi:hypothetical protein
MSLIDSELAAVVRAYRTCEFATLAKDGTPVAWPVSPLLRVDGTFVLTTSLGFPQKALNIRRDERVALLFSEPHGSGLDAPEQDWSRRRRPARRTSSPRPATSPTTGR